MSKLLCCLNDGRWEIIDKMRNDGKGLLFSNVDYAKCDVILDLSTNEVIKDRFGYRKDNNKISNEKEIYFLVDKDSLGYYGDEDGSTKERFMEILEDIPDGDTEGLVVIKGIIIEPKIKRTFNIE